MAKLSHTHACVIGGCNNIATIFVANIEKKYMYRFNYYSWLIQMHFQLQSEMFFSSSTCYTCVLFPYYTWPFD